MTDGDPNKILLTSLLSGDNSQKDSHDTSDLRVSERVRRYEKKTVKNDEVEKDRGRCSVCCDVFAKIVRAFLCWRWMGLVLGPVYGVLIYLYVTHLFLAGAPFTKNNYVNPNDNSSNTAIMETPVAAVASTQTYRLTSRT